MSEGTARIVLTAEDKTAAALASLRSGLAGITNQTVSLRSAFAGLVPVLTFAGAGGLFKSINDGVDALNDLKDATGASIENISALEDVAARTGTSFETVGSALIKFNQALNSAKPDSDAALALKAIGLEANALKKLDPAEALRRTAVALSGFADDGNKARRVQELFGRSIKEVAPFLNDLAEQTKLVGTVTAEQAAEAEKFNKELFALQKNATDAGRAFTADLVPALSALFKEFSIGVEKSGGFFNAIATLGTINPFRTQAENIRAYTAELSDLEQTRNDYLGRGFSTAAIDADIADVRTKLAYLKELQREAALAGGENNESAAEKRRLGLDGGGVGNRPSLPGGSGDDETRKRAIKELAKTRAEALSLQLKSENDALLAAEKNLEERADQMRKEALDRRAMLQAATKEEWRQVFESIDRQQEEDIRSGQEAAGFIDGMPAKIREVNNVAKDLGFTFSSAFEDAVIGGKEFSQVLQGIGDDITRIILRRNVTEPLERAVSGFDFGALFSGGRGGNTSDFGPVIPNAKGGVYNSPSLSAYSGGVYDSPQIFAFAKGAGVFGEAGAEAIMPLTRTASGDLGVRAVNDGGSSAPIVVNIIEAPGRGGEVKQRTEGGQRILDVMVEQATSKVAEQIARGNGAVPAALSRTYGLSRIPGSY